MQHQADRRARPVMFLLASGACLAVAAKVFAVPALPAYWQLVNGDVPVVANGVLLFRFEQGDYLPSGTEPALAPVVTDSTASGVAGAVELLTLEGTDRYGIFRPAQPLAMEGAYTVADTGTSFGAGTFTATDAQPLDLPMPAFDVSVAVQAVPLDERCCTGASQFGGPWPGVSCLALRSQQAPQVRVAFTFPTNASVARQFLYRVVLAAETAEAARWVPANEAQFLQLFTPAERAAEYCYEAEAFRITDGEPFTLIGDCVPDTLGTLSEVMPTEAEIVASLMIGACGMPPAELTQAWCEVNRAMCMDAQPQSICDTLGYAAMCAAFPPSGLSLGEIIANVADPAEPMAGSGGAGGAVAGAGGTGGALAGTGGASGISAGASGTAGMSAVDSLAGSGAPSGAEDSDGGGGCSITSTTPDARGTWLIASLVLVLAVVRVNRRRRVLDAR